MSVLVCVKSVGGAVSPFDEVATEAALRLREGPAGAALGVLRVAALGVTLVGGAAPSAREQEALDDERRALRHALALGADSAAHVVVTGCAAHAPDYGPLCVARAVAAHAARTRARLVLTGTQSSDRGDGCVPQMAAQTLGWLHCAPATALAAAPAPAGGALRATVAGPAGPAVRCVALPAVVACHVRMHTPRIPRLQCVLRARRAPVAEHTVAAATLFAGTPAVPGGARVVAVREAPRRERRPQLFRSAQQLVDALQRDGILP